MAQGTRYSPYDTSYQSDYTSHEDRYAEPVDLDTFGSQLRSHHPSRSVATREEFLPDDSVPLFLSGPDDELHSSRFGRTRKKSGVSRLLKIGAFAIAAVIATFVAVKNPFTVFANATASLIGTSDVRPVAAAATPPRQAVAAVAATTVAAPTPAAALATGPAQLPSRDEIALAL